MGFFDAAKAAYNGNRAYHLHTDANKLAGEGKVAQAKEKYQAALKLYDEAVRQGNNAPNIVQAYTLLLMREGGLFLCFDEPQRSITPGQFAAFHALPDPSDPYDAPELLGSGVISL